MSHPNHAKRDRLNREEHEAWMQQTRRLEDRYRYFLQILDGPEQEVSRENFIRAERAAGFHSYGGPDSVATGGFDHGVLRGRVRLALPSKGSLFDDGVAMDRHHYGLCHECGAEWDEYGDDVSAQIVVCPECGSLDVSEIGCEE